MFAGSDSCNGIIWSPFRSVPRNQLKGRMVIHAIVYQADPAIRTHNAVNDYPCDAISRF